MIELTILWAAIAAGVVGLAIGLFGGAVLTYYIDYKPLRDDYKNLVHTMVHMKKQGFVPIFEVKQEKPYDPSNGVDES